MVWEGNRQWTHRASASSDDAVERQGIRDTKGHSARTSRGLGIHGRLANGLGLLVAEDGSSSGVDMRGTTVCERVNHAGAVVVMDRRGYEEELEGWVNECKKNRYGINE